MNTEQMLNNYKPLTIRNEVIESIKLNFYQELKKKIIPNLEKTLNELLVKIYSSNNSKLLFEALLGELHKSSFTYIEFEVGEEWLDESKTQASEALIDILTFFNYEEFGATPIPIFNKEESTDTVKKFKGFKIHLQVKSIELNTFMEGVFKLEHEIPMGDDE